MTSILFAIGYGIASTFPSADKKIAIVKEYELHWVFWCAFIYSFLVIFQNLFASPYKGKFMKRGDLRSNMFIYKLAAEDSSESAIILEQEGDIGLYNRGNRSLFHFMENCQPMVLGILLNSFVHPKPTFFIVLTYIIGRVVYTLGYTKGFGGRMPGFMLD